MYGSVYYNRFKSEINWTSYDENNVRTVNKKKWVPDFFIKSRKPTNYKAEDGNFLQRVVCESWKTRRSAIKQYEADHLKTYGSDLSPENKFILEEFPGNIEDKVPDIHYVFIDIEVESEKGFPNIENPEERINLITLYSNREKKFFTFGLEHNYTPKSKDVKYIYCADERTLLEKFIMFLELLKADIWSGWNSRGFDVPYIFNRVMVVLDDVDISFYNKYIDRKDRDLSGEYVKEKWNEEHSKLDWTRRLSHFQHVEKRKVMVKDRFTKEMKPGMKYAIAGISDLDYLELFQQFTQGQRESYKLDSIAEEELGETKHHFEGSFKELYTNHWEEYVDYNIQDVRLLVMLENKLGYLKQSIMLSYICHCNFMDCFGTVTKIDCLIYNFLQKKGMVLRDNEERDKEEPFAGAWVRTPVPGAYTWLIDEDAASLYPNLLINLNISPDTMMFQINYVGNIWECPDNENLVISKPDGRTIQMTGSDVKKLIKDNNYTVSTHNTVFEFFKKKVGIIPDISDGLYSKRKLKRKEASTYIKTQKKIFSEGIKVPEDFL